MLISVRVCRNKFLWLCIIGGILLPHPSVTAAETKPRVETLQIKTNRGNFTVTAVSIDRNGPWQITVDSGNIESARGVASMTTMIKRRKAVAGINGSYFLGDGTSYAFFNSYSKKPIFPNSYYRTHYNPIMAVDTNNNIFFMWPHNANKDGSLTFENYLERVKKKSLAKGGSGELRAAFDNDPRLINSRGSVMYATGMPNIVSRELFYMKTRRNFIGWNKERFYLASVGRSDLEEFRGIIKNMGLQYAINVDAGGSTALYANGKYLHGPGRNIVNAVLIVPR